MKNLITRYPRTTGYTLIAALQLTVFFTAILANKLEAAHISNVDSLRNRGMLWL